jgi:hypothetical protein
MATQKRTKPIIFFPEKNKKDDDTTVLYDELVDLINDSRKPAGNKQKNKGHRFLQKREWLNLHEISCLICNREIDLHYTNDPDEIAVLQENFQSVGIGIPDDGYDAFFSLLSEAIKSNIEIEFLSEKAFEKLLSESDLNTQELLEQHLQEINSLTFTTGLVKGASYATVKNCFYDPLLAQVILNGTEVKVSVIREWLVANNIESDFFCPKEDSLQRVRTTSRTQYQTRLMEIMYETIERYYGENYDPNDRDTVTKQDVVVAWLMLEHSLSKRSAEAIDIIIRPEQFKSPKGRK